MKAVFLDRDGVINKYPGDADYVKSWEEFSFLPQVKPALKRLNNAGFKIFIVSNQAGISKGLYPQKNLDLITRNMLKEFKTEDIDIAGVYYCTHEDKDNCSCRKPKTGLIDMAIAEFKRKGHDIQLSESYFIGDTIRDIQAGRSANLKTILVFSGKEKLDNKDTWQAQPDFTAQDLAGAADMILKS